MENDPVQQERVAAVERQWNEKLDAYWKEICPPLYQTIDLSNRGLSKKIKDELTKWTPVKGSSMGLGIHGRSGKGKTRLTYWRLRQLLDEGWDVFAIPSVDFQEVAQQCFSNDEAIRSDAEETIKRCRAAQILFIDDIGKEKMTENVASRFYSLIERRISHLLPTIWTSNLKGDALEVRLGEDKGAPTIRRMREFSILVEA